MKLGSRTELILPRLPGLGIATFAGEKVFAGTMILARYKEPTEMTEDGADNNNGTGNGSGPRNDG